VQDAPTGTTTFPVTPLKVPVQLVLAA